MNTNTLLYVHDPMCSWCWGFKPTMDAVTAGLPESVALKHMVGGLAPDSDEPRPMSMQDHLQQTWQSIAQRIPGTEFNFDFWTECKPRRSTYPACRAVVAARDYGADKERQMIAAIQRGYYLQAKNPSDTETLVELAESIGLDAADFSEKLQSAEVETAFQQELRQVMQLGIQGFPSLLLQIDNTVRPIAVRYMDAPAILSDINRQLQLS